MTFTPPSRFYSGPITGIEACYGYPYSADPHCASCGSTKISKPSYKNGVETFRCNRCKRVTVLSPYEVNGPDARYDVLKNGHVEMESLARKELDDALYDVLHDLDDHYISEKASEYYGEYYDDLFDDDRINDASYQYERNGLEDDLIFVNKLMALKDGYIDGLEIGEEYNLPDFPVTVLRVADAKASANRRTATARRPTASKPKTSSRSVKAGKKPAKRTLAKKKSPARKPATRRY